MIDPWQSGPRASLEVQLLDRRRRRLSTNRRRALACQRLQFGSGERILAGNYPSGAKIQLHESGSAAPPEATRNQFVQVEGEGRLEVQGCNLACTLNQGVLDNGLRRELSRMEEEERQVYGGVVREAGHLSCTACSFQVIGWDAQRRVT
jgi:hypothetical protein